LASKLTEKDEPTLSGLLTLARATLPMIKPCSGEVMLSWTRSKYLSLTGLPPNCAFICTLSSAPFWASDKEQKKALVECPINVHENPIKPHEFGGVYFHLKGRPKQDLQN